MKPLSKVQRSVFNYILEFSKEKGYSPTFRDIQKNFSFSSLGSVYSHIKTLKTKGFLEGGKQERISIKDSVDSQEIPSKEQTELPIIGSIAAGFPIETFPMPETVPIPQNYPIDPDNCYVLKVKGDTLIEESLLDGDLLILQTSNEAHYGELVVATLADGETILKRYFPEDPFIRLENTSGRSPPLLFQADEIAILGVVKGVLRFC